ncbi:unnamed protein product [Adineta ricciae]|uniref:Uncharacterized protein n=1 Tax=Adineta ricciae TaxID=249248 RepID=A0A815UIU7_ADIRI|nr:unnamed protein product [Adineta ricciae]CAF1645970.1 unnamed protein product [Adineta ricciae]
MQKFGYLLYLVVFCLVFNVVYLKSSPMNQMKINERACSAKDVMDCTNSCLNLCIVNPKYCGSQLTACQNRCYSICGWPQVGK